MHRFANQHRPFTLTERLFTCSLARLGTFNLNEGKTVTTRRQRSGIVLLLLVTAVPGTLAGSVAANAMTTTPDESPAVVLSGYGATEDSFESMVVNAVQREPETHEATTTFLEDWQDQADSGMDRDIPHAPGGAQADSQVLAETLEELETLSTGMARLSGDADPADYKRAGTPANDLRTWRIPQGIDGFTCTMFGGCEYDRYRVNYVIDPARNNDRIQFVATYSAENSPRLFSDLYFTAGAYTERAVNLGDDSFLTGSNGGSGNVVLAHANAKGLKIQMLLRLHATYDPNGDDVFARNRTGLAQCQTGTNLNCIYSPVTPID